MENNQKKEEEEEGFSISSVDHQEQGSEKKKCCSFCKTTKTPLWRRGPSGPKSLCNACGIKYKKKCPSPTSTTTTSEVMNKGKNGRRKSVNKAGDLMMMKPLEKGLSDFVKKKKQRSLRQWSEVERAALLLMSLSSSSGAILA